MFRLIPLVLLCGCVATHNPQLGETKLNEIERDWVEIYRNEIKIAVENQDRDAYDFFMLELLKEKIRLRKINEKNSNNPPPR